MLGAMQVRRRPDCDTLPVTVSDHRDLVSALLGVPGVAAAAVEPVGDGPGTLRLQLAPGADEVSVAGEVNRLLRSRFGLAVDADRVRVLEESAGGRPAPEASEPSPVERNGHNRPTPADDGPTVPANGVARDGSVESAEREPDAADGVDGAADRADDGTDGPADSASRDASPAGSEVLPTVTMARPGRLVIERVELVSAGLGTSVSVSLGLDGRSVEGAAEGTASTGSLLRSVASATLRAVEKVVDGEARFDVEHVEVATTGPDRTALVVVTMVTGRATQRLSGASVVREDIRQAVIRAVLAAVNRRLEPMLTGREDPAP